MINFTTITAVILGATIAVLIMTGAQLVFADSHGEENCMKIGANLEGTEKARIRQICHVAFSLEEENTELEAWIKNKDVQLKSCQKKLRQQEAECIPQLYKE